MSISEDYVLLKILKEKIKTVRDRMQKLWSEKGYTDIEVLNASIELDNLMNEYQRRGITIFYQKEESQYVMAKSKKAR